MSARKHIAVAAAAAALLSGGLLGGAATAQAASGDAARTARPHSAQGNQCWDHTITIKGGKAYYWECRSGDGTKSWVEIMAKDTRTDGKCAVGTARVGGSRTVQAVSCSKGKWTNYHKTGWHNGNGYEHLYLR